MTSREPGADTQRHRDEGSGDTEQLVMLYREEYTTLVRFLMGAAGAGQHAAEDAAQATFAEAFRYMNDGKWESVRAPKAWLRRVAMRAYIRAEQRSREGVLRAAQGGLMEPEHDPRTERDLGTVEERHAVLEALENLPETQRTVLALQLDGFSSQEIAEMLGKTPETVRRNLHLARRALQERYGVRRMSRLDQHRRQLVREREKRVRLSNEAKNISKRLSEKRPKIAKTTSASTRKSRQREVDMLERNLARAESKVVDQDKVIAALQKKIDKEQAAEQKKRDQVNARRDRDRVRRDQAVDRGLDSLVETTSALDARLTEVEASSLSILAQAVARDPVRRRYDVFLSYATPDETPAGNLRDELQARGLDVWMADAQVGFGESIVTGIDNGIGASRCGICFVTPDYIDPDRFWPRQELAALIMGRKRVIPVISGLGFNDVQNFSVLLGDRRGLSTETHGLGEIADLIADSVGKTSGA